MTDLTLFVQVGTVIGWIASSVWILAKIRSKAEANEKALLEQQRNFELSLRSHAELGSQALLHHASLDGHPGVREEIKKLAVQVEHCIADADNTDRRLGTLEGQCRSLPHEK